MKKCTLCVDKIYNENIPEADRVPACVSTCPAGARSFGDMWGFFIMSGAWFHVRIICVMLIIYLFYGSY